MHTTDPAAFACAPLCCEQPLRGPNGCKTCGTPLCTHHSTRLRGCMLPRGHKGFHFNPYLVSLQRRHGGPCWSDEDGVYITSQEVWERFILSLRMRNVEPKGHA